jgi:putative ABC transport system ATP-binding protein
MAQERESLSMGLTTPKRSHDGPAEWADPSMTSNTGRQGSLLEARGIGRRKAGDDAWLLRDVSLAVQPGDRLSILGPSGAGKTLLLRALALLDPLDEGVVLREGQAVRGVDVPGFRADVVYLPQRPSLSEGDVEANLRLPFSLKAHRSRQYDRGRVVNLLEAMGREPSFLEKSHRDLSGGEAQIVAMVRVLQLEPSVLLLDEPTASLDVASARALEDLLVRWIAESEPAGRRAYVWVTHDRGQAERVTDRSLEMQSGRLVAGPSLDLGST